MDKQIFIICLKIWTIEVDDYDELKYQLKICDLYISYDLFIQKSSFSSFLEKDP
jgi:hypothetical protein